MLNPYPRLFRFMLLLFGLLSAKFTHAQQVFPVLSTLQINPPYSLYLTDYASAGSDKMQVNLFLKDLTKSNYPCRLRFKLEGFGITIQNKNDFYVQPFYLNPGELSSFSGSDLEPYFNPKNLVFQGLNPADYGRNGGKLPEGVYRISVEVLDYYQRSVVSNAGSTVLSVFLSYPPIINSPLPFSKVQALEPQNVIFQWVPRHTGSINAAYNVAYNFRLVELIPPDRDPNDAIRSTRPLFEIYTDQTILLYGPAEPALTPGNSYAVQVQAVEAEGKDLFINSGNSEVVKFTYGDKCAPPLNVLAQLNDQNSLKFTWDALPLQQAFTIRYREAGKQTAEWFEQETYTSQSIAQGLRPGKTYQYQVKAQCINGYGDYTPIQQFQMPDEKFSQGDFVCGKQPESTKLDKKQLLDNLLSGNVFTAGDFSVTVTNVSESQNGKFSGTGTITVPVLSNLQFSVAFNKISINSNYQMVDGVVKVGVQGLETPQQGNGLKELSAALSGLSSAFDDLLKELRKDKPDPKVLAQKSAAISSDMGSLQTDDERLQQDIGGVKMLVGEYIAPGVWAGLDDPAVKEAKIAGLIKIQEKTKEVNKKTAELEKAASEQCDAALSKITSLINNRQLDINFLKLLACESNPEKSTKINGKPYHISTYDDQKNLLNISYYSDAWPSSVDRLFLIESTDPKIIKEGVNKFWISYNPNRMYQDGKLPVTIYLKDIAPLENDPTHCRKDLDDLPKGISAGAALSDAVGEAVFYGATLGVSLEAAAAKKAAKCTGGVVLDVSFQLGINSLVKTYLGQPHEFSDLIKEVSIPSAATSCATAAFVEKCSGKCAGLAGFAAGAGDDILKQISSGKKLSEVKIEQSLLYGLRQGIIAILAQKGVGFAVSRWNRYTEKQLKDALADAGENPGKYLGGNASNAGNLPSVIRQLLTKPSYKSLRSIFSKPNKTTTFIGKWDEVISGEQNGLQKVFLELSENDLNIYMRSGKFDHPGGFNMLSIDNFSAKQAEYIQKLNTGQIKSSWTFDDYIWEVYNKPWLEIALKRGDDLIIWSDPINSRTGFYKRELDFIQSKASQYGYDYNLGISSGTFSK